MAILTQEEMQKKLSTKKTLSPAEMQAKLGGTTSSTPVAPKGDIFSSLASAGKNLARTVARTPLTMLGTAQTAWDAAGQLLSGQGDKAAETVARGSQGSRDLEKMLGYKEGEISRPYKLAQDIEISKNESGKEAMTGGGIGRETARSLGAAAELASYGMGVPVASSSWKAAKSVTGAKDLAKVAFSGAKKELVPGFVGGAGSAAQEEDATAESVIGGGAIGAGFGAGIGALTPVASKLFQKSGQLIRKVGEYSKSADDVVEAAINKEHPVDIGATWSERKAVDTSVPKLAKPLHEIDPEIFPEPAIDAAPIPEKLKKKALATGIKEGRINTVAEMSEAEKADARKMMAMADAKEINELAQHPMQVAAKPIVDQVAHLQIVRKESGAALDGLVDSMPKNPVSLNQQRDSLLSWLENRSIDIVPDEKGNPILEFSNSKFADSPKDKMMIERLFADFSSTGENLMRTPKQIRTMRQKMFLALESQAKATEPFSGETLSLLGNMRKVLNDPLAAISPEYAAANAKYAVSSDALTQFMKFLGKDFFGQEDAVITGRIAELLPRLISNTAEKPGIILKKLSDAAVKTGLDPALARDPRRLVLFADGLDDIYDMVRPRSFKGEIQRGVGETAADVVGAVRDTATLNVPSLIGKVEKYFGGDVKLKQRQILKEMLGEAQAAADKLETAPTAAIPETTVSSVAKSVEPAASVKTTKALLDIPETVDDLNLGEPKRTDPACVKKFRQVVEEHPDAKPVRGIFATSLDQAKEQYLDNIKRDSFKQLGGFSHIKADVNGELIDNGVKMKDAIFFPEVDIKS